MIARFMRVCVVAILACSCCASCSVTRKIPAGQYLVHKVTIEDDKSTPRNERIRTSAMEQYVRQSPNKRFLGMNFSLWIYGLANPEKKNGWNNFKRKLGQEPVLLDNSLTTQSAKNLKIYMDSKGFLSSQVFFEVDTLSRRKRASITYRTVQNKPYHIDSIAYDFRDKFLEQIILPDTTHSLLRRGEIFDITRLDAERERITDYLKQRGYFNFSVNNIEYVADTLNDKHLVGLTMIIKQYLVGYNERGEAEMENNRIYRVEQINVFSNYDPNTARTNPNFRQALDTLYYRGLNVVYDGKPNLRPKVLRQAVPFYPNYVYNADQVTRTYNEIMSLGYFRTTKVSFVEQPHGVDSASMVTYIGAPSDTTQTHYTKEGYLQCNILCTPALKQSFKVELEGSTTASFYGLKATVGYQNRNIFRGAEAFDIAFVAGYEYAKSTEGGKRNANEFGVTTGLSFPRFLLPFHTGRFRSVVQPKTKLEFSINFQDRPYYRRTLSSMGFTYLWSNAHFSSFSLRPIDINVIDMGYLDKNFLQNTNNKYLESSFTTQFLAGLSFGYTYNNQRKNLEGNATLLHFNVETVGNLVDGLAHLFSHPASDESFYRIFGMRYAQYIRTDLSVSRKIMLGDKVSVVGRLYGGVVIPYGNSNSIPADRLFYAGGSNGMRGWAPRSLGPGAQPRKSDAYPMQLADLKLEANLELRFPIWGIVHGATFLDLGNIWNLRSDPANYPESTVFYAKTFYKQLAFNTGLGLRLDIKFVILRLDWGIQLHNPNNPAGERWIHNFHWNNTALNFGVGYPF
ncbi:MAG: BamA/TamA family outer membrane protein [Alistipes sp.]